MQFLLDLANAAVQEETIISNMLRQQVSFYTPLCLRQSSLQAVETRFIGYSPKIHCKQHLKT